MRTEHFFVRAGAPADAFALAETHVEAWRRAFAELLPASVLDELSVAERAHAWRDRLAIAQGEDYFVLVAEAIDDGRVGGFCTAGGTRDDDRKGAGEVYALYVHPDQWRRGAGALLLGEALHRFRVASYEHATLWVLEANRPARAFYERHGWRADGTYRPFVYAGHRLSEVRYAHEVD